MYWEGVFETKHDFESNSFSGGTGQRQGHAELLAFEAARNSESFDGRYAAGGGEKEYRGGIAAAGNSGIGLTGERFDCLRCGGSATAERTRPGKHSRRLSAD